MEERKEKGRLKKSQVRQLVEEGIKSAVVLLISSLIGVLFYSMGIREANIITVYILGVLIIAVINSRQIFCLISSIISVILFNFIFTEPRFTLAAYDEDYFITFLTMFLSAFITSSIAVRMKQQAEQEAETAYRTQILLDTNQLIGNERDSEGIVSVTCTQLTKLLNKNIFYYDGADVHLENPRSFLVREDSETGTDENEKCIYLPVEVTGDMFGTVGIAVGDQPLDAFENNIMRSILVECALALKNERAIREREEAALIAKNEQLRANLLRSISHDLRTPLTSISGNAGILLSSEEEIPKDKRKILYENIYDDSLWLINLVENLLSVTRIEEGNMKLRRMTELLDEIITESLQHIDRRSSEHEISVKAEDAFILVNVDARLIMQVIINLVDNAIKYTPENSHIVIEVKRKGKEAAVVVKDDGPGIDDQEKKYIFDMFYTSGTKVADSRRSLGLGLALCKSIVSAHGGNIIVTDNKPHGAVFEFTLPIEEVAIHE
ncbi:MAG: ATP-binding protein [Lachnospiraceae bacterium]